MKWIDDSTFESLLKDMGIRWTIVTIKASEIDHYKTMDNVGRLVKLSEDKVDELMREMARGTAFPRMAAVKEDGKWIIVSGVTRYRSAKKRGEEEFPVYALECDTLTWHALAVRANRINGHRTTPQDLARLAVKMVIEDGLKCTEVCGIVGVTASAVSYHVRAEKMRRLMVGGWGMSATRIDGLAIETLEALTRLDKMPVLQKSVAEYAFARPKMTTTEIRGFITEVLACQSEEDRLEVVRLAMAATRSAAVKPRTSKASTLATSAAKSVRRITLATMQGLTSAESLIAWQQLTSLRSDLDRAFNCIRSSGKLPPDSQGGK